MPEPFTLNVALGSIGQTLLKEGVRWTAKKLTSRDPIRKAIDSTSERFGTRVPGLRDALEVWIECDAFREQLDAITSGLPGKTDAEHVDLFIRESGLQLGTIEFDAARETLTLYYSELYVQLCQADAGLGVIGARIASVDQKLDFLLAQHERQASSPAEASQPGFAPRIELDTTAKAVTADDQQAETELNLIKQLVDRRKPRSALLLLEGLQQRIDGGGVSAAVRFRFFLNKGVCHLLCGELDQASQEFERAKTLEPSNKKALINLAQLAHLRDDNATALGLLERVLAGDPNDTTAHSLQIAVLHELGRQPEIEELLAAQPSLLDDSGCLYTLAFVAFDSGRYEEAEHFLRRHNEKDAQHSEAWEMLGRAILVPAQRSIQEQAPSPDLIAPSIRTRLEEADACFVRAVDLLANGETTRELKYTLVNRGVVRTLLGRFDDARQDYERVLQIDTTVDEARRNLGTNFLQTGDPAQAVRLFSDIRNENIRDSVAPMLAAAYLDLDKPAEARRVLESVRDGHAPSSDSLITEDILLVACHRLRDFEACDAIVARITSAAETPETCRILAQHYRRIGDKDKAIGAMRAAVEKASALQKPRYSLLLAEMLYRMDEFEAAAKEYEQVPLSLDESSDCRRYLTALYNAGRLAKALEVARTVRGSKRAIPEFSEIEALILERSGDLASASDLRLQLLSAGISPARQRLKIASNHLRTAKEGEARPLVGAVTLDDAGTDADLLFDAARLRTILEMPDALEFAYRLLRVAPNNPESHLFYVSTFFRREKVDEGVLRPDRATLGCTVALRHQGEVQRFTLVSAGEEDPAGNRLGPDHRLAQAVQGKEVGQKIQFLADTPAEAEYEIVQIQSKYVSAFQDSLARFNERFPTHPGLMRVDVDPQDPTKIVQMLEAQRSRSERALAMYQAGSLPACTLARLIGRSDAELFAGLLADPSTKVRSSLGIGAQLQEEFAVLDATTGILVESSALVTLETLGLLTQLKGTFQRLCVTQQTLDSIAETAVNLDPDRRAGQMYSDAPGHICMVEQSRGQVEAQKQFFERIVQFLRSSAEIIAPSTMEALGEFEKDSLRQTLGEAACSTVAAAIASGLPMYSDDLALRVVAGNSHGIRSFWTQAVLQNFRARKIVDEEEYHRAVGRLIDCGMHFVSIGRDDLIWVLRSNGWSATPEVARFAQVLSGPDCNEQEAISLVVDVFHELWGQPVHPQSRQLLLDLFIQVLLTGRNPLAVFRGLLRQNASRSLLWTQATGEIQKAIQLWFSAKRRGL